MFDLKKDVYFITLLLNIHILYTYIYIVKNMLRILKNIFSHNTVIIVYYMNYTVHINALIYTGNEHCNLTNLTNI